MGGDGRGNPLTSPLTAHSALLDLGLSALVRADELRRLPRLKGHAVSMFIKPISPDGKESCALHMELHESTDTKADVVTSLSPFFVTDLQDLEDHARLGLPTRPPANQRI